MEQLFAQTARAIVVETDYEKKARLLSIWCTNLPRPISYHTRVLTTALDILIGESPTTGVEPNALIIDGYLVTTDFIECMSRF